MSAATEMDLGPHADLPVAKLHTDLCFELCERYHSCQRVEGTSYESHFRNP